MAGQASYYVPEDAFIPNPISLWTFVAILLIPATIIILLLEPLLEGRMEPFVFLSFFIYAVILGYLAGLWIVRDFPEKVAVLPYSVILRTRFDHVRDKWLALAKHLRVLGV